MAGLPRGQRVAAGGAEQLREPLIAVAEPEWMRLGAFGEQLPRTEGSSQYLSRWWIALRRAHGPAWTIARGFLNFGDW